MKNTQEAPEGAPFTSVQFEATELLKALSQLGGRKALPSTFAPASLWKLAPTQVTKALLPIINHAYDSTSPAWHSVQLYLIPKIPMVKEPKHLRPIALLHPGNKLHAAMLATRLQPKVASYLEQVPQWAYLPSRSTGDALKAVCAHMNQVRTLPATHSTSLPNRFQGAPQPKMHGGISICLDVKKAFDSLRHDFLEEAMREAQFDEDEIQTILFPSQPSLFICWET